MSSADGSPAQSTAKRGRKACTQCRQQKVRCNVVPGSDVPCSRCRKMNLECIISDPFKREHKRRRLSELERETTQLKRQLQAQSANGPSSPTSMLLAAAQLESMNQPLAMPPSLVAPAAATSYGPGPPVMPIAPVDPAIDDSRPKFGEPEEPTIPRKLDGTELDACTIDEAFDLFYKRCHMWLPILRGVYKPNFIYNISPFLFWAMLSIGIRRYPTDPSLLKSLHQSVIDLALMSLKQRDMSLSTLKALLLVVGWPSSRGGVASDVNFTIAGALPHVAMQLGLHIPVATQDFARVKVSLTESEIQRRAELWAFVLIVYQRLLSLVGQTPFVLSDTTQDIEQRKFLQSSLSPDLQLQLNLQTITSRCCKAMLSIGLQTMTTDQERAMSVLIEVFTQQVKDHEHEAKTTMDEIYINLAHLTLLLFHFYKKDLPSEPGPITQLFLRAVWMLNHLDHMDQEHGVLTHAPFPIIAGVLMSAFVLLRLLKSAATRYMDVERAKASFFLALSILKKMIVEDEDLPARNVQLLTQLWNSTKAFKNPDGSDCPALRIRSRVAMSPVFDSLWWWRTEFGGQAGAYAPAADSKTESAGGEIAPALSDLQAINGVQDFGPLQVPLTGGYNEQALSSDLGWAFEDNFFLSDFSLGPMNGFDNFGMHQFAQPIG